MKCDQPTVMGKCDSWIPTVMGKCDSWVPTAMGIHQLTCSTIHNPHIHNPQFYGFIHLELVFLHYSYLTYARLRLTGIYKFHFPVIMFQQWFKIIYSRQFLHIIKFYIFFGPGAGSLPSPTISSEI